MYFKKKNVLETCLLWKTIGIVGKLTGTWPFYLLLESSVQIRNMFYSKLLPLLPCHSSYTSHLFFFQVSYILWEKSSLCPFNVVTVWVVIESLHTQELAAILTACPRSQDQYKIKAAKVPPRIKWGPMKPYTYLKSYWQFMDTSRGKVIIYQ